MKVRNPAVNKKATKGMSLVELLIVMAILGIVLSIASFSWQRYVPKINLRSVARQVSADIAKYRAKAMAEGRAYTISFSAPGYSYNISALAKAGNTDLPAFNLNATPVAEVNAQDRQITGVDCGGSSIIMESRGLRSGPDKCEVKLKNSRGSEATVNVDIRGRVTVAFD